MENESPDKAWVTVGRKINLGNYESISVDAGVAISRLPDESLKDLKYRALDEALDLYELALDESLKTDKKLTE